MFQGYSSFVYRNDSVIEYNVDLPDSAVYQIFKLNKKGLVESIALFVSDTNK